jgi:hypothetical protein
LTDLSLLPDIVWEGHAFAGQKHEIVGGLELARKPQYGGARQSDSAGKSSSSQTLKGNSFDLMSFPLHIRATFSRHLFIR